MVINPFTVKVIELVGKFRIPVPLMVRAADAEATFTFTVCPVAIVTASLASGMPSFGTSPEPVQVVVAFQLLVVPVEV
jgi:hypothetical protein